MDESKIEKSKQKIPCAVLGATGSVGQRMVSLLENHPWFQIIEVTASERSAGRSYSEATRWFQSSPIPSSVSGLEVLPSDGGLRSRLVLSALDAQVAGPIEEGLAAAGHLVVSNAKNHRMRSDVPLLIPEVNPDHLGLIATQPYDGGAIITNPNCSTIGMALALKPLHDAFGLETVQVVTLQAASGAGYPGVSSLDLIDNVVPYISGEEEKMEAETRKIFGSLDQGGLTDAEICLSASCNRVPVIDGHTECVSVKFHHQANEEQIIEAWRGFTSEPQRLGLPSAPTPAIVFDTREAAPQPRLHRLAGNGMAITIGRLRPCPVLDFKFVVLSHNTIRGAAGGSVLAAELAIARHVVPALSAPDHEAPIARGLEEPRE